ncbi:MAG TPA: hypothetical protein VK772_07940 [Puia sp.]|jgi:hypothetical protein|nr:hypothetical protein [Puia sp.]
MGISNLTLYNKLCGILGEQESFELVEFIHSEVKAEMEMVKSDLDVKTQVFLTKEDKIDLIDRMDVIRVDLIDRMNKLETRLTIWIISAFILNYIMLMVSKKFF